MKGSPIPGGATPFALLASALIIGGLRASPPMMIDQTG
jgi:hypothetical protein